LQAEGALKAEVQVARSVTAGARRSVILPEVNGLAAQRVVAALPALDPGAAGQADLEPAAGTLAHGGGNGARPVAAFHGDVDAAGPASGCSRTGRRRKHRAQRQAEG